MEGEPSQPGLTLGQVNERVQAAIDLIGDGWNILGITITYDQPSWETADAWAKGTCDTCGATSVMRVSADGHLTYLANAIARYSCPRNGHDRGEEV